MKILLLGAGGMLARDIMGQAPRACEVIPQTRGELDITDTGAVNRAIRDIRPDAIINAAAYTNVDGAERERDLAFAVNGDAPGFIGSAAKALGVPVVHYSTDYVFDGSSKEPYGEDESTSPIGVYGASKLEGERQLVESGAGALIIRTQWLFGIAGPSFPRTMWKRATSGEATRVVDDQTGRPTYTVDLARATWGWGPLTGGRADGKTRSTGQQGTAWGGLEQSRAVWGSLGGLGQRLCTWPTTGRQHGTTWRSGFSGRRVDRSCWNRAARRNTPPLRGGRPGRF